MWLLIDIGNSSSKLVLHDGEKVTRSGRFDTDGSESEPALRQWVTDAAVARAGAVSVVPGANDRWSSLVRSICATELEFFDSSSHLPFELAYETPATLGNDRIAAAAGAWRLYGDPADVSVIAVDAGTAITYEVVTSDGVYPGGAIAPGPELLRRAVHSGTAQLPFVELNTPDRIAGRSTDEAIRSGIMNGFIDAVDGMIVRIRDELSEKSIVVLTGGWGEWLKLRLEADCVFEPDLVNLGVRELMLDSA